MGPDHDRVAGRKTDSFHALTVPVPPEGDRPSPSSPAPAPTNGRLRRPLVSRAWTIVTVGMLVLGPFLAYGVYQLVLATDRERVRARFEEALAERKRLLAERLVSYAEVLHSVRAHFRASEEVTAPEFEVFTREARSRHRSIYAVAWAPRVEAADRSAFERAQRERGNGTFVFRERSAPGQSGPSAVRPEYHPIVYLASRGLEQVHLGLDLLTEPAIGRALLRQHDVRDVVLSDPFPMTFDPAGHPGAVMLLAVGAEDVSEGAGSTTPAGQVALAFLFEDLMRNLAMPAGGPDIHPMSLELIDEQVAGRPVRVFNFQPEGGTDRDIRAETRLDEIGGQTWLLRGSPTAAFFQKYRTTQPLVLALIVFLVWELFAGFLLVLARSWRSHALTRQARLVHSVLRSLGEGVVVADRRGRVRLANEAALRLVGRGSAGARPGSWSSWYGFHREDGTTPYPEDELPLARATRGERFQDEHVLIRNPSVPDGLWVSVGANPLLDEWNQIQGGVIVMRDITARRKSQEELSRLSSAVEQTADAVLITDRSGTILYVNPAFERTTGYSRDEVLGRTPRVLKSGEQDPEYYGRLWSTVLRGEVFRSTAVNRKKSGELLHVEQTITPMRDASGAVTHFVSVSRDMTERRRIEEQEVEMRLAAQVQQRLYPPSPPHVEGLDLAGAVLSAEATCGDYYDYLHLPGGVLGVAIGDVCGHGLGPALVMAETRAYLRSLADAGLELSEIFHRVNQLLLDDLMDQFFVTLLLVGIDVESHRCVWANAGHTPGYLMDAQGRVRAKLAATGTPLGLFPDASHRVLEGPPLEPGDVLLLVTDGAPESQAPGGRFLEEEGVVEMLRAHRHRDARSIVEAIRDGVRAFTGGRTLRDDITLVAVKVAGLPQKAERDFRSAERVEARVPAPERHA